MAMLQSIGLGAGRVLRPGPLTSGRSTTPLALAKKTATRVQRTLRMTIALARVVKFRQVQFQLKQGDPTLHVAPTLTPSFRAGPHLMNQRRTTHTPAKRTNRITGTTNHGERPPRPHRGNRPPVLQAVRVASDNASHQLLTLQPTFTHTVSWSRALGAAGNCKLRSSSSEPATLVRPIT